MSAAGEKVPAKYRKYFWAGWYVRWEWRYKCHLCGRKGYTPYGIYKHLISRHGLEEWEAFSLRNKAVPRDDLDEKRIRIGDIAFCVGGEKEEDGENTQVREES